MATFRERPHALSITAVCTGLAQHHPLGLDEKHINVTNKPRRTSRDKISVIIG